MNTYEYFSDELLHQAATELAMALNNSLPLPNECMHEFSNDFEGKMQFLIRDVSTRCYNVTIQKFIVCK